MLLPDLLPARSCCARLPAEAALPERPGTWHLWLRSVQLYSISSSPSLRPASGGRHAPSPRLQHPPQKRSATDATPSHAARKNFAAGSPFFVPWARANNTDSGQAEAGAEAGASSAPQLSCTAHPPLLCIPLSCSCGLHSCIVRRIFHTHYTQERLRRGTRSRSRGDFLLCRAACCSWVSRILHAAYTLELLVAAICTSSRTFCFKTSCSSLSNFPFHLRICFHGSCQAWGVTVAQLGLSYGYWAANELNF